jgi:glycosyltransferase involved in cell wall biosynthesis
MRTQLDPARHVFSFQTQSMYDSSVPGIPHYLYTDHTHLSNLSSAHFDRRNLRSASWRALERSLYHNVTCAFTRSSNVKADLDRLYDLPPSQSLCVFAGTNVAPQAGFAPKNDSYRNRNILFVGHDWERKGGPELATAFAQVIKAIPDARLTIVGATPKLALPNCTVLGRVPIDQVSRLYSEASIFCLPTRLEPFGIAFLEAMAHRLPIIGTRVGAVPDMVVDGVTGLLVDPGDAAQITRALATLLNDPSRCARFGQAGYSHLVNHYTWEAVGMRVRERIMRDLAGKLP